MDKLWGDRMKIKYIIFSAIMLLFITSCGSLTSREKFIKNDYEVLDEVNYQKYLNETDYYLFNLETDIKYFIYAKGEDYQIYFFENDWASIDNCEYDLKNNKAKDGYVCSSEEVVKLNKLKEIVNGELEKLKITIDDLNQV